MPLHVWDTYFMLYHFSANKLGRLKFLARCGVLHTGMQCPHLPAVLPHHVPWGPFFSFLNYVKIHYFDMCALVCTWKLLKCIYIVTIHTTPPQFLFPLPFLIYKEEDFWLCFEYGNWKWLRASNDGSNQNAWMYGWFPHPNWTQRCIYWANLFFVSENGTGKKKGKEANFIFGWPDCFDFVGF